MSNDAITLPLPDRPVVAGFHPDPSVCRVDDTFYLACSSFEYLPGVPIFASRDLVSWEQVGHALERPTQVAPGAPPSGGVYAPTLRHHDGRFWLVTTDVSGPGHLIVSAENPAGPWSDAVRVTEAGGIDPDLAWDDDDGTCYLTWTDGGIVQAPVDPASGRLLGDPQHLWSGTGGRDPEGPHLYRVGDTWYLLVAEGGTGPGHAVTVARGPAPTGPFEPCPRNPFLTARGTPSAVQNTGHADLVRRADGTWAVLFLGVRPAGAFPGWHVLGRETFAADVEWVDGWPCVTGPLQPSPTSLDRTLDGTLDGPLPLDWVGAGVLPADVLRRDGDEWLLTAPRGSDERVFVGRRQEHREVTVRAEVQVRSGTGGVEIRIDPTHGVAVEVDAGEVRAVARVGGIVQVLGTTAVPDDGVVAVELHVRPSSAPEYSRERGPDVVLAVVDTPGGSRELGRLDGRYVSTEVAGGFTGRMVGLTCADGEVVVRSFRYAGHD